ncbi:MAG: hypothetical protein ABFS12_12465 [Bacteroidota bacterium]
MITKSLDAQSIRIVVTDSGLGGISVLAELERKLKETKIYKNVELLFFNALYSKSLGYNSMKNIDEKAAVFNNALFSIQKNYDPEIILIACNTLSVIYHMTPYSEKTKIKVEGIVKNGIELFLENLKHEKENIIILFGTPTTIESQQHKRLLIEEGIDENRIVDQSCPMLESEIQDDPSSNQTKELIQKYVDEASEIITSYTSKVYAGLCCTHYGYSTDVFYNTMKNKFGDNVSILNPNDKMVEELIKERNVSYRESKISVKIVSQVEIYEHEKQALSNVLRDSAPLTVKAIKNYEQIPNLFGK